jgi:hypothetical protein
MNQIRNAHFYGRTKCTLGENGWCYTKTCEEKVVALSKDVHTWLYLARTWVNIGQ